MGRALRSAAVTVIRAGGDRVQQKGLNNQGSLTVQGDSGSGVGQWWVASCLRRVFCC